MLTQRSTPHHGTENYISCTDTLSTTMLDRYSFKPEILEVNKTRTVKGEELANKVNTLHCD
jgi:hypothetical protein